MGIDDSVRLAHLPMRLSASVCAAIATGRAVLSPDLVPAQSTSSCELTKNKRRMNMDDVTSIDLSAVGPHRRTEVLRRIGILDQYLSGEMTSTEAIEGLAMSEPSFWRLLRTWRQSRRPELIGASGRQRKPRFPMCDLQKRVLELAERSAPSDHVKRVVGRALKLGIADGVEMPGETNIAKHVLDVRRARGLRPDGVHDLVLVMCAVDLPIVHPRLMTTASPLMSVLVDIGKVPVVLGLALAYDGPTPALAARTVLDAIARAEASRPVPVRSFHLSGGPCPAWRDVADAVAACGVDVHVEEMRPRSARAITPLLGARPGGIRLFPDRTGRTAEKRTRPLRPGGQTIGLPEAEELLKGRFSLAFPGPRMTISDDAEAKGRLSSSLQRIAAASGECRDVTDPAVLER
jgi:hypothetical protein